MTAFSRHVPTNVHPGDAETGEAIAQAFDPAYAVVLRGILDADRDAPSSRSREDLLTPIAARFAALRSEMGDKLAALTREIPERFGAATLGLRLQETGWYREGSEGGWETSGRGTRREMRSLFLLAFRDLVNETERILVQVQSRCEHLDDLVAKQWLQDDPGSNGARIPPVLCEGLRAREAEAARRWRSRVGALSEERFSQTLLGGWERRAAHSLPALHRLAASPWAGPREDGFSGFARIHLELCRAVGEAVVWLSLGRWRLHLGGLSCPSQPVTETP